MSYVFSKALQNKSDGEKSTITRKWSVPSTTNVPAPKPVNRGPPPVARKPSTGNEVNPQPAENTVDTKSIRSQSVDYGIGPKMGGAFARLQMDLERDDDTPKSSIYSDAYNQYRIKRSLKEHGCLPKDMRGDSRMKKLSTSEAPIILPKPSKESDSKRDAFSRNRSITLPTSPTSKDCEIQNGARKSLSRTSSVSDTLSETLEEEQKLDSSITSDTPSRENSSKIEKVNNVSNDVFVEEKPSNIVSEIDEKNVKEVINPPVVNGNVGNTDQNANTPLKKEVIESSTPDKPSDIKTDSNEVAQDVAVVKSNPEKENDMAELKGHTQITEEKTNEIEKEKSAAVEELPLNEKATSEPIISSTEINGSVVENNENKAKGDATGEPEADSTKEASSVAEVTSINDINDANNEKTENQKVIEDAKVDSTKEEPSVIEDAVNNDINGTTIENQAGEKGLAEVEDNSTKETPVIDAAAKNDINETNDENKENLKVIAEAEATINKEASSVTESAPNNDITETNIENKEKENIIVEAKTNNTEEVTPVTETLASNDINETNKTPPSECDNADAEIDNVTDCKNSEENNIITNDNVINAGTLTNDVTTPASLNDTETANNAVICNKEENSVDKSEITTKEPDLQESNPVATNSAKPEDSVSLNGTETENIPVIDMKGEDSKSEKVKEPDLPESKPLDINSTKAEDSVSLNKTETANNIKDDKTANNAVDKSTNVKQSDIPESETLDTGITKAVDSEKIKDLNNNANVNAESEDTML